MLKKLELSFAKFKQLKKYCAQQEIDFLASVFGAKELDFYTDELNCKVVKFGSGELNNFPLLLRATRKRVKILLSTGMADLNDIRQALEVIAFGYTAHKNAQPNKKEFVKSFNSQQGQAALKKNVLIFQCTSLYPCPDEAVNLRAMQTIAKEFGLPVGFSDHSSGFGLACAARALGARMIEKHLTYDKKAHGPDHQASLDVAEFTQYVREISAVEKGLGNGKKTISSAVNKIAEVAGKKIIAAKNIKSGEFFSEKNLTTQRTSGKGMQGDKFYELIGKKSSKAYQKGNLLNE